MSNEVKFTWSDLIAGHVTRLDADNDVFFIKTSGELEYRVTLSPNASARLVRNLGEGYRDATGQMREMLTPGRYVFAYGIFYPDPGGLVFDLKQLTFLGTAKTEYRFERSDWWIRQIKELGHFYVDAQFGDGPIDYREYRTALKLTGEKGDSNRQENNTISRLVYGFASAYMLTGDERFLEGAAKGTDYLRDHLRYYNPDEDFLCWYHAVDIEGWRETQILPSQSSDDYDAIPAYEQIYALAGPVQTYRITGDPRILRDAERTVKLFDEYYRDKEKGGFYSHLDPVTFSPLSDSLKENKGRKNWNSVGDHAPAYLINLWLATGEQQYADFLEDTFDTIAKYFPDYDNSSFVQEKFFKDWSHDEHWKWQQNRGVVGHNLKIAWNIMRMNSLKAKDNYVELAEKIAKSMYYVGFDLQRGGIYDVMERVRGEGQTWNRHAFHDRKAWWQQEQAILAYYILAGCLKNDDYHRIATETAAFYNTFFLDYQAGGVYFNVLANGIPYLLDTERGKGSHSMSGYHSFELCYLAAVYSNLLVNKHPMDFYFKPRPDGFKDRILRVQPDILPPGSVRLETVWIEDKLYTDFDPAALTVKLPDATEALRVKVHIVPVE
ncbi:MAG: AGE family epimerase/isomerase [Xenococcaceae cyanobacterium]